MPTLQHAGTVPHGSPRRPCGRILDPPAAPTLTPLSGSPGLAEWRSVPVEHCSDAHGLVLRAAAGWSLVFSGDTRPCAALASAGRGATLLVHEATFEPALLAQVRRHPLVTCGLTQ